MKRALALVVVALLPLVAVPTASAATVERLAGTDRYSTAAAVSAHAFDSAEVVYVASGESYADALAAAPVAASASAPVLLTARDSLPAATRTELTRLGPSRIVVVGGSGAVSDAVVESLRSIAGSVTRVAGADRYTTATLLTADFEPGGVVYVASGESFADALAGGALAGRVGAPLLLVPKAFLPSSVAAELHRLDASEIVVFGGTGSVSDAVVASLGEHTSGDVRRVSGADRYATSAATSAEATGLAATVVLATGATPYDALAGGAAAAALDAPILLVPGACLTAAVADELARLNPDTVLVLGGRGVVARTVENLSECPAGSMMTVVDDGTATLAELDLVWEGVVDGRAAWGDSGPIAVRVTDTTNDFSPGPGAASPNVLDIYTSHFRDFGDDNGEAGQYNVIVHEYFHTLQMWLANRGTAHISGTAAPVWLIEGSASYFGSVQQTETYTGDTLETVMATHVDQAKDTDATLCSLYTHADVYSRDDTTARLSVATLATEYLVDRYGESASTSGIYTQLASSDFPAAFAAAFGTSLDGFCSDFEEHRSTL